MPLYELDDLHQLHFVRNQQMVREIERLRVLSTSLDQQRETWKLRALVAEAQLLEATSNSNNNGGSQKVSDRSGVAGSLGALSSPWPCVSSSRRGAPCSLGAWSSRRPCVSGSRGAPQARSAPASHGRTSWKDITARGGPHYWHGDLRPFAPRCWWRRQGAAPRPPQPRRCCTPSAARLAAATGGDPSPA